MSFDAKPAELAEGALAVARNVDALGAGIGDDALQPVPVRHQAVPRGPGELGGGERLCRLYLFSGNTNTNREIFQDLPVGTAAAVLVVGDHLFAAGADDADARL